jgi:diguanylate cyclase (GGDEF)-like protein
MTHSAIVAGIAERTSRSENFHRAIAEGGVVSLEEAIHEAAHDTLTGAYRRSAGLALLQQGEVLVLFDLDGFKAVNDTLGHRAGDIVLATVVARVRDACDGRRPTRLGGDEFALTTSVERCAAHIDAIRRVVQQPIHTGHGGAVAAVGVCVGWSLRTGSLREALDCADRRMFQEKAEKLTTGERSLRRGA